MAPISEERKRTLTLWDEVQFRSVSDPPEDLSALPLNDEVFAITSWFYENFEDPAEHTPYESREGAYQYIWGGPYEARDIIESVFDGYASEKAIETAIGFIENENDSWVPNQSRQLPPDEDFGLDLPNITSAAKIHQEILESIAELRPDIEEFLHPQFGVGHNGGPTDEAAPSIPPLDERDFRDLLVAFKKIEETKPWPERAELTEIETSRASIENFGRKIGAWISDRADVVADGVIKGAALSFGKYVGDPENWSTIYTKIEHLLTKIQLWIASISPLF